MTARRVADTAVNMNKLILTRATGTPTLRAADGSPPAAKIQFPNGVRKSIQPRIKLRPIHHQIEIGKPSGRPMKIGARKSPSVYVPRPEARVTFVKRRVNPMVSPRSKNIEANVMMNEGSLVLTTNQPFT